MAPSDLKALEQLLASTLVLLAQFTSSLASSNGDSLLQTAPIIDPPDPLGVLKDSATLLKAHTTKLSLLAINKPFTPTALTKVLRDTSSTCIPAMMSATQTCTQQQALYGALLRDEVNARVRRILLGFESLLQEIQGLAANGGDLKTVGNSTASKTLTARQGGRRDSLASTGVVWESCDALIELAKGGIAGLAVKKAEQWRDTIRDAVEELKEWREGTDVEAEGRDDGLLDSDDEGVGGDADGIEDLFNAANSLPKDRPELRELVEAAEGRLKKVVLLYTALIKRRFRTFKFGEADVAVLDRIVGHLKRVPHRVDELAAIFYDLDEDRAKEMLEKCVGEARIAGETAALGWRGEEDEFTVWSRKWSEAVG